MELELLIDFAEKGASEIAKFKVPHILSPAKLTADNFEVASLDWDSIGYGPDMLDRIPNDRRGVYAFAICLKSDVLPPHGYILYVGIAGRDSSRPLRQRYKDYLNARKVSKRPQIARMIGTWHNVLRFWFAPVGDDVSSQELKALEQQLNTALLPPFSEGDLEAEVKRMRKAFRQ